MEFDMELSGAHGGVNNNVYVTFPSVVGHYCDSGGTGGCAELDFAENNGNCESATTFHTDPSGGDKDGTQYTGAIGKSVHVRAEWDQGGDTLSVTVNGNHYSGKGMGDQLKQHGAVLYSSQWTGWVQEIAAETVTWVHPPLAFPTSRSKAPLFKAQSQSDVEGRARLKIRTRSSYNIALQ